MLGRGSARKRKATERGRVENGGDSKPERREVGGRRAEGGGRRIGGRRVDKRREEG